MATAGIRTFIYPVQDRLAMFDQNNLDVTYQPAEQALEVSLTLYDDRGNDQPYRQLLKDLQRTSLNYS